MHSFEKHIGPSGEFTNRLLFLRIEGQSRPKRDGISFQIHLVRLRMAQYTIYRLGDDILAGQGPPGMRNPTFLSECPVTANRPQAEDCLPAATPDRRWCTRRL